MASKSKVPSWNGRPSGSSPPTGGETRSDSRPANVESAPRPLSPHEQLRRFQQQLPLFDGYPYLNIRVVEAMRHLTVLPGTYVERDLRRLARAQADANRFDTCLVLAADRAIYFPAEGGPSDSTEAPRGGLFVHGLLQPAEIFEPTEELTRRARRLDEFVEGRSQRGYVYCRARTNRRQATPEELVSLAGDGPDGLPKGVSICKLCGWYRGPFLETEGDNAGWIAPVHCLCENHNRCALCGQKLYSERLNSFTYDPSRRCVGHQPGFSGLSHRCPSGAGRLQ